MAGAGVVKARRQARATALKAQAREVYREGILAAAERVFATRGFGGARMADVAGEAGLAIGTLYNYFTNKGELLSSLIEESSKEFVGQLEAIGGSGRDLRESLEGLIRTTLAHFDENRWMIAMLLELGGLSDEQAAAIGACCRASKQSYVAVFEAVLARARSQKRLRSDLSPATLAAMLTGAMHGLVQQRLAASTSARPLAADAPHVLAAFLDGIGRPP